MAEKIRVGLIGTGFIGAVHIDALRRIGGLELVAVAEATPQLAEQKAREYFIPKAYGNYEDLINDPEIEVVHNCTPNNMHLAVNSKIIEAGKHIFSEKPLAMNAQESRQLLDLLKRHPVIHGVNFNYRMYPLVQDMKYKIANGDLGNIWMVHGSYLQDWLFYDTDFNWRIEPEISGRTRAIGDLGSHWCDLVQSVTGLKIVQVMADFSTVYPVRKKSKSLETFQAASESNQYERKEVKTEDWATVMVRFDNGAKGVFSVSEVCAGRKCLFNVEINGSRESYYWNQEEGDQMWIGRRDGPNQKVFRDPNALSPGARSFTIAPAGHPEGWLDAIKGNISAYYHFLMEKKNLATDRPNFATFEDGHDIMCITDAIALSNETGAWQDVVRQ